MVDPSDRKGPAGVSPFDATSLGDSPLPGPGQGPALDATQPQPAPGAAASSSAPASGGEEIKFLRPFGPFSRVEALSEQGAMGVVARGYNEAFDRWELLKFLRAEHALNPELVRQFQREGRILAKLSHPNVVQVFAIYALDGRPCLAMEFLEGQSLGALIEEQGGKLPVARWHELFLAAARGLAAAHEAGLLHRDIKPENLFVLGERKGSAGGLKLIDFGLATADRNRRDLASSDPSLVAGMSGGTPLYMAPELWRREEATPRSDIYALGLSFFVAAVGKLPYRIGETAALVALAVCDPRPFPEARELRPELPAALSAVLRRALSKDPAERFETADELVAQLAAASSSARARRVPGSGPYRGLGSFSAAERDVFFGRDVEIAEVLERLRSQAGVVLVGPSGAGKSSLAHAGVVPAVEDGALGGELLFRSARFEPRAHPVASLAAALAQLTGNPEKELLTFLRSTPQLLGEALRSSLPPGTAALLVVDQLEEISTIAEDPAEVADFCRALGSLTEVSSPPLRVLATLRADLMDRLFAMEPLRPLLTRGFYPVRPLLGEALRRALEGPALAAGYVLEDPAIADAIVADVARTPAGLPLLSFAMASWWQARDEGRKVLPTAAWKALGGLAGALAAHGDGVLEAMGPGRRGAAERILVRLVTADGTRARVARSSLIDPAAAGPLGERALSFLVQAKLLHESEGEVELVHEALIRQWPALRQLLVSSGEDRAFRERVSSAAREWDAQDRPPGMLWTDEQAARLLLWFAATPSTLDQIDLAFIEAVRRRIDRRKLVVRSSVFAVVALALSFGLTSRSSEKDLSARLAQAQAQVIDRERAFHHAEAGRLLGTAAHLVLEDPSRALATALESYEQEHLPAADIVGWHARMRGLAYPLPLHAGGATATRVAPVTGWIATAGQDGAVRVLSPSSPDHALLRASREAGALPRSLDFSPDGTQLAIASSLGEITVASAPAFSPRVLARCPEKAANEARWHGPTSLLAHCPLASGGVALLQIAPASGAVHPIWSGPMLAMALSRGADLGAIAPGEGKLVLFDPQTGATVGEAKAGGTVTAMALSMDGHQIVVALRDGSVASAPVDKGNVGAFAAFPERFSEAAVAVSVSPGGAVLAVSAERTARLWFEGHAATFEVGSAVFSWAPRRGSLLIPGRGGEVLVLSAPGGEQIGRLIGATAEITAIATDPEERWAFVTSRDGGVRAYSLEEATSRVSAPKRRPPPAACAVSPDGTALACALVGPDKASSLAIQALAGSAGGPKEPRTLPLAAPPALVALSPGGKRAAWCGTGACSIEGRSVAGPEAPAALTLSERHAAIAGRAADHGPWLRIAPLDGPGEPRAVTIDQAVTALAFSRDGSRLVAVDERGLLLALDPATGIVIRSRPVDPALLDGEPTALALSDDGALAAIGTRGGALITVAIEGQEARRIERFRSAVSCVAWSQSGRALVAAMADRRVVLTDADSREFFVVGAGAVAVASCARSPFDDRYSFSFADGLALVRLLDVSPIATSRPPEPALDPRSMPVETWKGLPLVGVR